MRTLLLLLATVALCLCAAQAKRYDHYKVVEVHPDNQDQVDYLRHLQLTDVQIDFWDEVHRPGQGPMRLMVSPKKFAKLSTKLLGNDIKFKVVEENVQRNVDEESARLRNRKAFDIDDFNTLQDIESELMNWVSNCAVNLRCELADIGQTSQNRNVKRFSVSAGSGKPAIYVDATVHAREWLTTATILKVIYNMRTNYGSDPTVTRLLDAYDFHFVAVANPDGYAYTSTERYWRKNRAANSGSSCLGTDLNRNFNWMWGREGVSTNPCSDIYAGSSGNSELETQAVVNELTRISGEQEVVGLITLHSYGRMWMHPWGNTVNNNGFQCQRASDHNDMYRVAAAAADAVQATGGGNWQRGTSCEVIYETTGATDDWAKGVLNVKFPFNPELRGNDFVVNRNQIEPSFQEVMAGIAAMVDEIGRIQAEK